MKKIKKRFFVLTYCFVLISALLLCQFGSDAVTAMIESMPLKDRTVIVIDAGHGGVDGGATSCTGILESQTNLEISLKLNDILNLIGYKTLMIRKTDISVYTEGNTIAAQKVSDLKNRVKMINDTENAILISIHQNTFSNSKYQGAQVFYANDQRSIELAKQMQHDLIMNLNPGSSRQAKKANGIYLMEHIQTTGILIECGFISNHEEAVKLNDAEYQKKICAVIAASFSTFISNT